MPRRVATCTRLLDYGQFGLAEDLEQSIKNGVRKVVDWADRHGTVRAEFDYIESMGHTVDPFFNANTPDELDEVRAILTDG